MVASLPGPVAEARTRILVTQASSTRSAAGSCESRSRRPVRGSPFAPRRGSRSRTPTRSRILSEYRTYCGNRSRRAPSPGDRVWGTAPGRTSCTTRPRAPAGPIHRSRECRSLPTRPACRRTQPRAVSRDMPPQVCWMACVWQDLARKSGPVLDPLLHRLSTPDRQRHDRRSLAEGMLTIPARESCTGDIAQRPAGSTDLYRSLIGRSCCP